MRSKILIIDDETDFCAIMKNYFMKKNYEVFVAYTLKEGLSSLNEIKPDVIFLDNNLPDGNGWDAASRIVEIIPQIRLFLVSAHRNKSTITHRPSERIIIWEKPISLQLLNNTFPSADQANR